MKKNDSILERNPKCILFKQTFTINFCLLWMKTCEVVTEKVFGAIVNCVTRL